MKSQIRCVPKQSSAFLNFRPIHRHLTSFLILQYRRKEIHSTFLLPTNHRRKEFAEIVVCPNAITRIDHVIKYA